MDGLGWDDLDGVCQTVLAWPLDAVDAWVLEAAEDPMGVRALLVRWNLILCIVAGRIYWGGSGELVGIRAYPRLPGSFAPPSQAVDIPQTQIVSGLQVPVGVPEAVIGRLFEAEERRQILRPTFDHLSIAVARPALYADPLVQEVVGVATTLRRPLLSIVAHGEEGAIAQAGWLPGPSVPAKRRNRFPALQLWSTVPLR